MPQEPLLTIVVPVYNRRRLALPTLDCLAAQTLRPLRVILVDNGSTDGTHDMLRGWKRRVEGPGFEVSVLDQPLPGAAAARQKGLDAVTTPYTMFFDSDDLMAPGHAARAVDVFLSRPDADIAGWDVAAVGADGATPLPTARFYARDAAWHNIMHGSLSTQRYAARTELFRRAGGWDPAVRGWDDMELGTRLMALDPVIVKSPGAPTVTWVGHGDSISGCDFSSGAGKWEGALRAIARNFPHDRRMRRMALLKGAILAGDYEKEGARNLSARLMERLLSSEPSAIYRLAMRAARYMRGRGMRGVARLMWPLYG